MKHVDISYDDAPGLEQEFITHHFEQEVHEKAAPRNKLWKRMLGFFYPTLSPPSSSSSSSSSRSSSLSSSFSLNLWNSAYDSLRDDDVSAALVAAYEAVITQQLPDHLKPAGGIGSSSFRRASTDERLMLMATIAEAGLRKRRRTSCPSASATDESVRLILASSADMIESVWAEYPSAALAWSGISTLTPLLLQSIVDGVRDLETGTTYIVARIPYYTRLSDLLVQGNWKHDRDFQSNHAAAQHAIARLYAALLEFQMNCVCAAASTWSPAARHVVAWNRMGGLVDSIRGADRMVSCQIEAFLAEPAKANLLRCRTI